MGLGSRVVGVSRFDDFPEEVRRLPRVGGYLDPNWEAVLRLQPDLLLVMESQERVSRRAATLSLPSCRIDQHNLSAVLESFERIADCCGMPGAGAALRARVQLQLGEISEAVGNSPAPRVLVVVGRMPHAPVEVIWAAAPGSLYDDLLQFAGGVNAIRESGRGPYPEIGREGIISLDPDVILDLLTRTPEQGPEEGGLLRDWEGIGPLRARRENQIHILRDPSITIPGPRLVDSTRIFARILHPEAF